MLGGNCECGIPEEDNPAQSVGVLLALYQSLKDFASNFSDCCGLKRLFFMDHFSKCCNFSTQYFYCRSSFSIKSQNRLKGSYKITKRCLSSFAVGGAENIPTKMDLDYHKWSLW